MMMHILPATFFDRPVAIVARDLIGKFLVRKYNGHKLALQITETEGYDGAQDLASHARFGKTDRTFAMFEPAGSIYIYFVYGMYYMLNIVTGPRNTPAGVLIRGAGHIIGPGRLTKKLGITKELNAKSLSIETGLWIEDRGIIIAPQNILATPRIGIAYAGPEWSTIAHRFVLKTLLK